MFSCAEVKNISEEKTDEADAEWLMLLHSYGLLKPSFQPENAARQVRNLARHRSNLLRSAGKEVQHMQKAMGQMNLKLTNVISDIVGLSGQRIISAILEGNGIQRPFPGWRMVGANGARKILHSLWKAHGMQTICLSLSNRMSYIRSTRRK